jgi:hypothetical protein
MGRGSVKYEYSFCSRLSRFNASFQMGIVTLFGDEKTLEVQLHFSDGHRYFRNRRS